MRSGKLKTVNHFLCYRVTEFVTECKTKAKMDGVNSVPMDHFQQEIDEWNIQQLFGHQYLGYNEHEYGQPQTPQQAIVEQKPVIANVPPMTDHKPITADLQSVTGQHLHGKQENAKNIQSQQPGTSDAQPLKNIFSQIFGHEIDDEEAESLEETMVYGSGLCTPRKRKRDDTSFDQPSNDNDTTPEASASSKKPKISLSEIDLDRISEIFHEFMDPNSYKPDNTEYENGIVSRENYLASPELIIPSLKTDFTPHETNKNENEKEIIARENDLHTPELIHVSPSPDFTLYETEFNKHKANVTVKSSTMDEMNDGSSSITFETSFSDHVVDISVYGRSGACNDTHYSNPHTSIANQEAKTVNQETDVLHNTNIITDSNTFNHDIAKNRIEQDISTRLAQMVSEYEESLIMNEPCVSQDTDMANHEIDTATNGTATQEACMLWYENQLLSYMKGTRSIKREDAEETLTKGHKLENIRR